MAEFNSTRLSATVAHCALIAAGIPNTIRETGGAYQALELLSRHVGTRIEVRSYAAGVAFQFLDKDPQRRQDFMAAIRRHYPPDGLITFPTLRKPVSTTFAEDKHDRNFVYANWSFSANDIAFTPAEGEVKMAMRALLAVEVAKALHPIAVAI